MSTTAVCVNADCTEYELPKDMAVALLPGESVLCGGCGRPCELRGDPPPMKEPPA